MALNSCETKLSAATRQSVDVIYKSFIVGIPPPHAAAAATAVRCEIYFAVGVFNFLCVYPEPPNVVTTTLYSRSARSDIVTGGDWFSVMNRERAQKTQEYRLRRASYRREINIPVPGVQVRRLDPSILSSRNPRNIVFTIVIVQSHLEICKSRVNIITLVFVMNYSSIDFTRAQVTVLAVSVRIIIIL